MRRVRGNEVAMIFQDPMTSLNPTWTIGRQIAEPVRLHEVPPRLKPNNGAWKCSAWLACRGRRSGSTSTLTSCPEACASG